MSEQKEVMKTGTTTVGVLCKDGVVIAADKRATAGYLVANKTFEKVMKITDNIAVTVAGTVSDVQLLVKYIKAELKLKGFKTNMEPTVKEAANLMAMMLYNNIRKYSLIPGIAHFVMAGKDDSGFHLYDLSPDGSIAEIEDYVTSGSGSVYSLGVLETLYEENMSVEEGVQLVAKAITASIRRDVASGNGIDILTITKDGVKKHTTQRIDPTIEV